jgi:hypothetical protein
VLGYQFGAFSSASLGSGAFAPRLLGRPQFTVTLRPPPTASDDGYSLHLGGSFSLTLRRGRVRQQLLTVPTG